ncbi:hypothetical protein RJ640_014850 [Escallonia rubra]|uniref:Uncharacterized protein n=1 Tax=Escallonia rubra TaxID=112253 RepID=A0AA88RU10_9ASTE|nr:hypothetical protein RJ640_014850 [Escallonia rubra]
MADSNSAPSVPAPAPAPAPLSLELSELKQSLNVEVDQLRSLQEEVKEAEGPPVEIDGEKAQDMPKEDGK